MSSHSYTMECSACGNESLYVCQDTRPYDSVDAVCVECGWGYYTKEECYDLAETNNQRKLLDLKPLKKLAERKYL